MRERWLFTLEGLLRPQRDLHADEVFRSGRDPLGPMSNARRGLHVLAGGPGSISKANDSDTEAVLSNLVGPGVFDGRGD